jgi:CheY-like chemotaxis protein
MVKILVAEDDTLLSSLVVKALQTEGMDTQATYDGVETTERISSWQPDVVLLDILMPNKDGLTVLTELRADPHTADLRVIVMSNLGDSETIDQAKKLNVIDYIVKANTTPHEIAEKIKSILT